MDAHQFHRIFHPSVAQQQTEAIVSFIDAHRVAYAAEPIRAQPPITPSMYYEHEARERNPERATLRVKRDLEDSNKIQRVWDEHFQAYGVQKGFFTRRIVGWRVASTLYKT